MFFCTDPKLSAAVISLLLLLALPSPHHMRTNARNARLMSSWHWPLFPYPCPVLRPDPFLPRGGCFGSCVSREWILHRLFLPNPKLKYAPFWRSRRAAVYLITEGMLRVAVGVFVGDGRVAYGRAAVYCHLCSRCLDAHPSPGRQGASDTNAETFM